MDYDNIGTPTLPSPHGSIFTALLISMVGILATSLAVVVYHIVIVKCCLRRQPAVLSAAADPRAQPVSTGVDAKVLEAIPVLPYSKAKQQKEYWSPFPFHANQSSECAVCLAELEEDDVVRLLPSCRHAFHITCIDQWFIAHTNCPICRSPVTNGGHRHLKDQLLLPRGQSSSCLLQPTGIEIGGDSRRPPPVTAGGLKLKRSLSMGQSYVIIDARRESEKPPSSSSTSKTILGRSRSYRGRSVRQLDGASSTLRRSFSRLRNGLSGRFNQILPY